MDSKAYSLLKGGRGTNFSQDQWNLRLPGGYMVLSFPPPRKKIFRHTPDKFLRMPLILRLPRPNFKNLNRWTAKTRFQLSAGSNIQIFATNSRRGSNSLILAYGKIKIITGSSSHRCGTCGLNPSIQTTFLMSSNPGSGSTYSTVHTILSTNKNVCIDQRTRGYIVYFLIFCLNW